MSNAPDLDAVIAHVREEARRPEYQVPEATPLQPLAAQTREWAVSGAERGGRSFEGGHAEYAGSGSPPRSLDAFLVIGDDARFIEQAYQCLFERSADPVGLRDYGSRLDAGYGRPFVLAALAAAPEAGPRRRRIQGLGLAPLLYNLWRVSRRIGLEWLGRWCNRAYAQWRQWRLLVDPQWLATLQQWQSTQQHQLAQLDDDARSQLKAVTDALGRHVQTTASSLADSESVSSELRHTLERLMQEQRILQASVQAFRLQQSPAGGAPAMRRQASSAERSPPAQEGVVDNALATRLDTYYLAFEATHRGTEAEIRAAQMPYLNEISQLPSSLLALPVLDLGCGRGEWLALLREHGFQGRGIDSSTAMVNHCQRHGLSVAQGDAVSALEEYKEGSLAAVSAFHLVEHLPFPVLFRLLEEAARALAPGGMLLVETPNAENVLVGSHTFYHDFSHRNPVTHSSLDFLLGYFGLVDRVTLRLNPYPPEARIEEPTLAAARLNGHLYGPQDLGMVARKPVP
ncbi:class I SAM-dependent methyltransferase [Chromatocurvus halotolerans]|uniref:O-antigen chain-terminating methyltransferase n=1 Tax=Chromatocurvus halotolerans TaxID=1132028 RepID=A0A4R2KU97_9GAMM|nr:class I SAM-dependent methyltransferase [Chromatocurvus halotolerans]TCO73758.1 O-antigen chain-terminating methyltransferase [Chromatocurvus halotolerans]